MTLCFLNSPLSSLLRSVSSTALFHSMTICHPLGPSVLSTAFCLLYSPLSLYGPLFPLRSSVSSTALCTLYGPLSPPEKQWNKRNDPLVSQNVLKNAFRQHSKSYRDLFRISDNRDYRDNHDYYSSETLSDNREIAIVVLAKKVR
jgi:hypothetical protein